MTASVLIEHLKPDFKQGNFHFDFSFWKVKEMLILFNLRQKCVCVGGGGGGGGGGTWRGEHGKCRISKLYSRYIYVTALNLL